MLLIHENLPEEASHLCRVLQTTFGFPTDTQHADCSSLFIPVQQFPGYFLDTPAIIGLLRALKGKPVFVITDRDTYASTGHEPSQEDDWVFGSQYDKFMIKSVARLKRADSKPSTTLQVSTELYLQRLSAVAIHEVGHATIRRDHMQLATWVANNGNTLPLGPHCTDPRCVMYEIVDIRAPTDGHLQLGEEKKYDAGLDDVLERIYPDWFCTRCKDSLDVDATYF